MTNKTLIKLNVELARTAHHAYLDCVRVGLVKLAVDWKLRAQDHLAMARAEKADAPMTDTKVRMSSISGSSGRFWDW